MEAIRDAIDEMYNNAEMVKFILLKNGITQNEINDFIKIHLTYLFVKDKKAFAEIMNNIFTLAFLASGDEDENNNSR
jgi:hypothetical protein